MGAVLFQVRVYSMGGSWRPMLWGIVSLHAVGEQLWECACWVFVSPLLVRLACVSSRRVVSISRGTDVVVVLFRRTRRLT